MSEDQRQSLKLLEFKRFDACKNTTAPIIAMLGHSGIDTEISDIGMETTGSDDYRDMSRDNRDTNSMLVTI